MADMKSKSMPDAAIIVSKMGAPKGEGDEDMDAGKDAAITDLMNAIKSGDSASAKEALTAFIEMCY